MSVREGKGGDEKRGAGIQYSKRGKGGNNKKKTRRKKESEQGKEEQKQKKLEKSPENRWASTLSVANMSRHEVRVHMLALLQRAHAS